MKICYLYKKEDLVNSLPDFHFVNLEHKHYSEDENWVTNELRMTNQDTIVSISTSYGIGSWTRVNFVDKQGKERLAESVKYTDDDTNPDRIKTRDVISPKLYVYNDNYIERTEGLEDWLMYHGVDVAELDKNAKEIKVYHRVEYPGVPTASLTKHGNWCHSSEDLVLDEREINTVLNSIEDIVLRQKIKDILYARVFKKRY